MTASAQATGHLTALHASFLLILPRIELHGRIYFRSIKCRSRRAEAIQEMRSLAWKRFSPIPSVAPTRKVKRLVRARL